VYDVRVYFVLGLLSDMKGVVVTSVALGKAHGVMLTSDGHVYTFGPNNKGQCGRDVSNQRQYSTLTVSLSAKNSNCIRSLV